MPRRPRAAGVLSTAWQSQSKGLSSPHRKLSESDLPAFNDWHREEDWGGEGDWDLQPRHRAQHWQTRSGPSTSYTPLSPSTLAHLSAGFGDHWPLIWKAALTALAAFALLAIASLAALAWSSPQRGSADSVPFREDIWPPGTLRGTGASEQRRESSSLWASTTSQQQQKQAHTAQSGAVAWHDASAASQQQHEQLQQQQLQQQQQQQLHLRAQQQQDRERQQQEKYRGGTSHLSSDTALEAAKARKQQEAAQQLASLSVDRQQPLLRQDVAAKTRQEDVLTGDGGASRQADSTLTLHRPYTAPDDPSQGLDPDEWQKPHDPFSQQQQKPADTAQAAVSRAADPYLKLESALREADAASADAGSPVTESSPAVAVLQKGSTASPPPGNAASLLRGANVQQKTPPVATTTSLQLAGNGSAAAGTSAHRQESKPQPTSYSPPSTPPSLTQALLTPGLPSQIASALIQQLSQLSPVTQQPPAATQGGSQHGEVTQQGINQQKSEQAAREGVSQQVGSQQELSQQGISPPLATNAAAFSRFGHGPPSPAQLNDSTGVTAQEATEASAGADQKLPVELSTTTVDSSQAEQTAADSLAAPIKNLSAILFAVMAPPAVPEAGVQLQPPPEPAALVQPPPVPTAATTQAQEASTQAQIPPPPDHQMNFYSSNSESEAEQLPPPSPEEIQDTSADEAQGMNIGESQTASERQQGERSAQTQSSEQADAAAHQLPPPPQSVLSIPPVPMVSPPPPPASPTEQRVATESETAQQKERQAEQLPPVLPEGQQVQVDSPPPVQLSAPPPPVPASEPDDVTAAVQPQQTGQAANTSAEAQQHSLGIGSRLTSQEAIQSSDAGQGQTGAAEDGQQATASQNVASGTQGGEASAAQSQDSRVAGGEAGNAGQPELLGFLPTRQAGNGASQAEGAQTERIPNK